MSEIMLILDIALIAAVCIGVLQASRVLRQLKELKKSKVEMGAYVKDFAASVDQAQACLRRLKGEVSSRGAELEELLDKARPIRDELMFLTESAEAIADRLSEQASLAMKKHNEQEEEKKAPIINKIEAEKLVQKLNSNSAQELALLLKKVRRNAA
ncbi:MAG: DUF6468 domain-containing protein [Alphaproteobacteria bacterium]|nr:DUF6468 domain-containing protein [Alphaproteobacteria bacterium]MCL2505658.1 DUF6468 domain-containing protein [Alphaproteobacteria bacterium]